MMMHDRCAQGVNGDVVVLCLDRNMIVSSHAEGRHLVNTPGQVESNKQVLHTFLQLFMSGNWDDFQRVISRDCVMHYSGAVDVVGLEPMVAGWREYYGNLRDMRAETHAEVSEGDILMMLVTLEGTYEGSFEGQAVGPLPVKYRQAETLRIVDGKIVEWWVVYDEVVLAKQLGFRLTAK
jgi:predicted ester cyclase